LQSIGRGIPVGYPWSEKLRILASGSEVPEVDLSHSKLMQASESLEILATIIATTRSIHTLLLSGNAITDAAIIPVLLALQRNNSVSHLDLSYNKLSGATVDEILLLLETNTTLERIYVQGNLPDGAQLVITPNKEASIWNKLSRNHVPDVGMHLGHLHMRI
jgi:Leucine-rich repeat (LRR) protein